MSDELEEATRIIEDLVGLEHFRVTEIPSKYPRARLYMARTLHPMTIGIPPS